MEVILPVVKVSKKKPPAEPPPSSENKSNIEIKQYIEDIQSTADNMLHADTTRKIARLQGALYTPIARAQKRQGDVQQFLLSTKINDPYTSQHQNHIISHIINIRSIISA